jgi:carbamoylphosphate synthase large subunit
MKTFEKYIHYVMLALVVLIFFRTCGVGSDVTRMKKEIELLREENITKKEMVKIIKETPNWKTLEIEELSDKNKVPINFFKNDLERDTIK